MGDLGSIPGLGRSSGGGNGYPHQYSGLGHKVCKVGIVCVCVCVCVCVVRGSHLGHKVCKVGIACVCVCVCVCVCSER